MPIVLGLAALCAFFGLIVAGKVVTAVALLLAPPLVVYRGGYLLAWLGLALVGATGIRVGPLVISDLFLLPALLIAIVRIADRRRVDYPSVPLLVKLYCFGLVVLTCAEAMFGAINLIEAAYALRLALIIVGMPIIFIVFGKSERGFDGLLGAYVVSASANGLLATLDAEGFHYASRLTGFQGYLYNGGRYTGLALYSNQLGFICVLASPIMLYLASKNRWWYVCAPLILSGVFASGSRGSLVGVPIAIIAYAVARRRSRLRTLIAFSILSAVGVFVAESLHLTVGLDRLFQGTDQANVSDADRLDRASQALHDIATHPIFGLGFQLPTAHNTYLEILRDGGLIAAVPLFLLIGWAFVSAYRARVAVGPTAAVLTWALLDLQFNGVYERYLWVPFGAVVAAVATSSARSRVQEGDGQGSPASRHVGLTWRASDGEQAGDYPQRRRHVWRASRGGPRRLVSSR